ncbi:MAG: GspH/FimT family pseudopilin [Myxococcota bacterium]
MPVQRQPSTPRAAFTLLELLAVVAIFALMATFVVPNFPAVRARALRQQANQIAARLELARQRAIVTGTPHRLWINLDAGSYRLEWLASEAQRNPQALEPTEPVASPGAPISLSAPPEELRDFHPVPGLFGNRVFLEEGFGFAAVETPEGWIESGETFIDFDRDGTASYTTLVLDDEGGASVELELLPLADAVRIAEANP